MLIMGFADKYLNKQNRSFFFEPRNPKVMPGMVVVIPCYNEPGLLSTLESMTACSQPRCDVQIIVVVNDSENDSPEVKSQNSHTVHEIENLKKETPGWLHISSVYATNLPSKHAGVGWARKIGMDWAVSLFSKTDNSDGIILSLDADATVEENYFKVVFQHFSMYTKPVAATIYFEHPYDDVEHEMAVVLYELYMRYYKHAIDYTGFPNSIYTLGSCFALKASAYVAQGGMNRRKAGEDFYFLHKLMPLGKVGCINRTTVYPSTRLSTRVPFGTGPALKQFVEGGRDLHYTYPLYLFEILQDFFYKAELLYRYDFEFASEISGNKLLIAFFDETGFVAQLNDLKQNCSNEAIFSKRFFHLFDAFKILKWLNFCLSKGVEKKVLKDEALDLLNRKDTNTSGQANAKNLLNLYRTIDKNS
jgi:glycosyltransferase involved in cell wall biosynthesis